MIRLVVFVLVAGLAIVGCERIVDLTPHAPPVDAPGSGAPPIDAPGSPLPDAVPMDTSTPLPDAFGVFDAGG